MGRIDEALRRAADGQRDDLSAGTPVGTVAVAFPAESLATAVSPATTTERVSLSADAVPLEMASAAPEQSVPASTSAVRPDMTAKLVGDDRMLTTSREQYRRLAATLHRMQATNGIKVILVASAVAGEGKTLTAANLALTFGGSYKKKVLLIDADLRRPSLARTFNLPGSPGLADGLLRGHEGPLPLHQISPLLSVLTAGRATPDPMAGLTSDRMHQLITEARDAFDWCIVDTPPIGLMTDANLLSSIADGTVLVVKAGDTPYHLVRRAVEALGQETILGIVLNRAIEGHHASKYYAYYHYAPDLKSAKGR